VVLIIDGNNIAYIENCSKILSNKDGFPTQAIYGFFNKLRSWVDRFAPDRVFVAWDGGRSAKRMEIHPGYKASRKEKRTPQDELHLEDFKKQVPIIKEHVLNLGCWELFGEGCEADDLIGLMARTCTANSESAVICSTDKDFLQLVSPCVSVFRPINGQLVTTANMETDFGLRSSQWLDFRCIVGDDSDDIAGVKGAGEKTAKYVLKAYGSLNNFFRLAPSKLPKRVSYILDFPDIIERNRRLMDLYHPVSDLSSASLKWSGFRTIKVYDMLFSMGIYSITGNFEDWLKPFLVMRASHVGD
jgi:DNA polymerase I